MTDHRHLDVPSNERLYANILVGASENRFGIADDITVDGEPFQIHRFYEWWKLYNVGDFSLGSDEVFFLRFDSSIDNGMTYGVVNFSLYLSQYEFLGLGELEVQPGDFATALTGAVPVAA